MLKLSRVAIALLALTSAPLTSVQLPTSRELSGAEFPPQDVQLWLLQHQGLTVREADATSLPTSQLSPDTPTARARERDAPFSHPLRWIVDARPSPHRRRPRNIWRYESSSREEMTNWSSAELRCSGKSSLTHDRSCRPCRRKRLHLKSCILMLFDGGSEHAMVGETQAFIDKYRGTETALLAEVDCDRLRCHLSRNSLTPPSFIRAHPGTTRCRAGVAL